MRNLKRVGIEAACEKIDERFVRVTATATTEKHVTYLEIRGYQVQKPKRTRKAIPKPAYPDVVQTILARPQSGSGGGVPLTRGEVAMLFLDGYAGDDPSLLDVRSQGYGDDNDWDGLTHDDVLDNTEEMPGEAAFVWTKWEPLELWPSHME